MERVDRRSFLAGGLKLGAAAGAAGIVLGDGVPAEGAPAGGAPDAAPAPGVPGAPVSLTVNSTADPVGVDPDDLNFGWRVTDSRLAARQGGYRVVVTGTGAARSEPVVWDSGPVRSDRQAFVPYAGRPLRGATRYRWRVTTADAHGRWGTASAPAEFTTGLREADWRGEWLRPGPPDPGEEAYTYLRRSVKLPAGRIATATVLVAAAHKYQLWVNGERLDTGPSFCFPDEQYYQGTDVTGAALPGRRNVVGILHHWYGPGRGRPTSAPGLLVQLTVRYVDGTVVHVGSDGQWRTRPAEWLPAPQRNNDGGDFVEWIDGRRSPAGWASPDYDDEGWAPAAVLGPVGSPPFTRLFAQRTRIQEQVVRPVSRRLLPSGSVVVDFGAVYAGRPVVTFRHGVAGRTVPMHVGYTLDADGSVSTTHNTQGTDLSFSYTQRAGSQVFDPYWYLGFRYLQLDEPGEPIGADQVSLAARHARMPRTPVATFTSSSRRLDQVWALCARSGLYCSQEQFIDTPTREKGQFLWDAANESETVMRAFGDQSLSWQGLRDMARAQARYWPHSGQTNEVYPNDDGAQNYPLFTARFPEWVWRYYLSTGDEATTVALLPVLTDLSQYLTGTVDRATGLMSGLPMSTNGDNEYGYDYDTAADTTLNILAVNALRRIGEVAALAGDGPAAASQGRRATVLAAAVNARLVRGDGVYVDGLRADGTQSPVASQLANVAALAYGVVPAARLAEVASYVASLDISVEPDHGMELLRALHAGGRDHDIVRILTDTSFPGWAAILARGGTFTWETWTPSDLIGDSMSHGWGSSALVAMQEALLGAAPVAYAPGSPRTVMQLVTPAAGLPYAAGTFPSPAGEYSVLWQTTTGGRRLVLGVPPNAGARCRFPGVAPSQVTESLRPATARSGVVPRASGVDTILHVGAGRYDFVITTT